MQSKPKPFSWSYSKLKNYDSCPKRHFHVDLAKDFKEDDSEALMYGNAVHDMLAKYISKGTPIPAMHAPDLQKWGDYAITFLHRGMKLLVEQKLAIAADFTPSEFFGPRAWYRGVADVVAVKGPIAIVLDWKTGKILDDSQQLALTAACIFAHYPSVFRVRTEFVWLKDQCTSGADFNRDDMPAMWAGIWPRITELKQAHDTASYPPKPGFLCRKYCPVTTCSHHGQSR